jgi:hypothetical protein
MSLKKSVDTLRRVWRQAKCTCNSSGSSLFDPDSSINPVAYAVHTSEFVYKYMKNQGLTTLEVRHSKNLCQRGVYARKLFVKGSKIFVSEFGDQTEAHPGRTILYPEHVMKLSPLGSGRFLSLETPLGCFTGARG